MLVEVRSQDGGQDGSKKLQEARRSRAGLTAHRRRARLWEELAYELGVGVPDPYSSRTIRDQKARQLANPYLTDARSQLRELTLRMLDHPVALADRVQHWIEDGGGYAVRPVWDLRPGGTATWRAEINSLFAAIGVGLWNAISSSKGVSFCPHCQNLYPLTRRDKPHCGEPACVTAQNTERQQQLRQAKRTGRTG
jgi:hypothetical protein